MAKVDISVIDFAMQAEKEGVGFYTKAANMFKDNNLRALFMKLAKEEAKHLEEFINLKEKALKKGIEECFKSVEVGEYLEAVAREGIFPKGEGMIKKLEAVKTVEEACKIALQAERNSILLYTELVRLSKDKAQRKILERLLDEEKSHLVRITSLRADHDPVYMFGKFGRD
jgi:rubrerythrin